MNEFHYEKVKDPTYFSENRVAAHSDHRYYGSAMAALAAWMKSVLRESLNGLWKFHYAKELSGARFRALRSRRLLTVRLLGRHPGAGAHPDGRL